MKQNGVALKASQYVVQGTILEVLLNEPIAPKSTVVLEMDFESQVPLKYVVLDVTVKKELNFLCLSVS